MVGEVVDPGGQELSGAELTAIRQGADARPGEPSDRPRATAVSDRTGEFVMELPGPGTYPVTATARGLLPATAEVRLVDGASSQIRLQLAAGGIAVRGRFMTRGWSDRSR